MVKKKARLNYILLETHLKLKFSTNKVPDSDDFTDKL